MLFKFSCVNENATIAYFKDASGVFQKLYGPIRSNQNNVSFGYPNNTATPLNVLITGWNKAGMIAPELPWRHSVNLTTPVPVVAPNISSVQVGFDDGGGNVDYNDAVVVVDIL